MNEPAQPFRSRLLATALLLLAPAASAVEMEWVLVADPGNACDIRYSPECLGAVADVYLISKHEVTNAEYAEFLNAVAATDTNALYDTGMGIPAFPIVGGIARSGRSGRYSYSTIEDRENKPVNHLTFWDALRFANWLHNDQPQGAQDATTTEDGAYTLTPSDVASNTVERNPGATVFLPTENEWYKAAYYDPVSKSHFDYPAGSDTKTRCGRPWPTPNRANCGQAMLDLSDVGSYVDSASPLGTFDQGGNVWEWTETIFNVVQVIRRGGGAFSPGFFLATAERSGPIPALDGPEYGFRVAALPACNDARDNDADDLIDFPEDPGCSDPESDIEDPACDDGVDNDSDGLIDFARDNGCDDASSDSEDPFSLILLRPDEGNFSSLRVEVEVSDPETSLIAIEETIPLGDRGSGFVDREEIPVDAVRVNNLSVDFGEGHTFDAAIGVGELRLVLTIDEAGFSVGHAGPQGLAESTVGVPAMLLGHSLDGAVRGSVTLDSTTKPFEVHPGGLSGDDAGRQPGVLPHTVNRIEFGGLMSGGEMLAGGFGSQAGEMDLGAFDDLSVVVRAEFWMEGATFVIPEPSVRLLQLSVLGVLGLLTRRRPAGSCWLAGLAASARRRARTEAVTASQSSRRLR